MREDKTGRAAKLWRSIVLLQSCLIRITGPATVACDETVRQLMIRRAAGKGLL